MIWILLGVIGLITSALLILFSSGREIAGIIMALLAMYIIFPVSLGSLATGVIEVVS